MTMLLNLELNPQLGYFCGYTFPILKSLNFVEIFMLLIVAVNTKQLEL